MPEKQMNKRFTLVEKSHDKSIGGTRKTILMVSIITVANFFLYKYCSILLTSWFIVFILTKYVSVDRQRLAVLSALDLSDTALVITNKDGRNRQETYHFDKENIKHIFFDRKYQCLQIKGDGTHIVRKRDGSLLQTESCLETALRIKGDYMEEIKQSIPKILGIELVEYGE